MKRLRLWWAKRKLAKKLRRMDQTGIKLIISAPREDAPAEQLYLVGQDITACKCGEGDRSVVSYFVKTTRYVEQDLGHCSFAWVCEQCDDTRCFDYPLPEDIDFNFCPKCGRKITEFVKYQEEDADGGLPLVSGQALAGRRLENGGKRMSEVRFERPDYCKGCKLKAYGIATDVCYNGDGDIVAVDNRLVCENEQVCKMWHERLKEKPESEDEE